MSSKSGGPGPHCLGTLLWQCREIRGNKVNYVLPKRDLDYRITRGRGGVSEEIMPTLKDKMD